ncbi:hypothetical protein [Nocardia cyriacigeorgica]|uniref:hypothetical protein n=1 Tax=Nocardia cyriacigeorgica TaxID=135487 RepID=UPI001486DD1C|nr:hypothetical protein [Nocardia cyriacigeorgica]MBF6427497.1 hypothetical protein [Nocardia cyriacigeorgica]
MVAIVGVAVIGVAYAVRDQNADDIETTLELWAETFNGVNRIDARQQLTCAENRTGHSPRESASTSGTEIDVYSGVGEMKIGLGLDTAYAEAMITTWDTADPEGQYGRNASRLEVGFELRKENGEWKVCDWGSSNGGSDSPISRSRFSLLGWKISGPPS